MSAWSPIEEKARKAGEHGSMNWRALLAAGIFLGLLVAAVLMVRREEPLEVETASSSPAQEPPPLSAPQPPLTRADLIDAAGRAADAHARGVPPPPDVHALAGRRFTMRIPFGCAGPGSTESQASLSWTYDSEQETLRATVTPEVWTETNLVQSVASGVPFEAAEGFWISKPWIRTGECPRSPSRPIEADAEESPMPGPPVGEAVATEAPDPAPPETLAIVELFEPGSRRAARRNGRPYEVTAKIAPGDLDLGGGLRLVIEGRLAPLAGGGSIACRSEDADRPPLCLILTEIERVAVTDASGERVLGQWTD